LWQKLKVSQSVMEVEEEQEKTEEEEVAFPQKIEKEGENY